MSRVRASSRAIELSESMRQTYGTSYRAQLCERGAICRFDRNSPSLTEKRTGEHGYNRIVIERLAVSSDCHDQQEGSAPLGATVSREGVNFSLYSREASSVELLLFNRAIV